MKTERHDCSFCEKQLYRQFLGPHYVKFHLQELKKNLSRYLKTPTPHFPLSLSVNNKYICICCYDVQTQKARAEKHAEQNPECSYEKQLQALWLLLEIEPPEKPKIVVTSSHTREKTQLAEAKESETEYFNKYSKCVLTIENLQAQNKLLQEQNAKLREQSTHALEAKNKLFLAASFDIIENYKARNEMLIDFLPKSSVDRFNVTKKLQAEDENKLVALLMDVKQYHPNFTIPTHLDYTKMNNEPVVEPTPEQTVEPTPEPIVIKSVIATKPVVKKQQNCCEKCSTSNEFTDLTTCTLCKSKQCEFNQLNGCFIYDCNNCDKKNYCRDCYVTNGGTKQFCSKICLISATG